MAGGLAWCLLQQAFGKIANAIGDMFRGSPGVQKERRRRRLHSAFELNVLELIACT